MNTGNAAEQQGELLDEAQAQRQTERNAEHPTEHHELVKITINNHPYDVHRGRQSVAALKTLAGIPSSDELDEVIHGQLDPLPDDGAVTIKGGEDFKSNLRVGHTS